MTWDGKNLIGMSHSTTSLIDNSATIVPNSIVIHIRAVQLQTIHHTLQCMNECGEEEEGKKGEEEEEEEEEEDGDDKEEEEEEEEEEEGGGGGGGRRRRRRRKRRRRRGGGGGGGGGGKGGGQGGGGGGRIGYLDEDDLQYCTVDKELRCVLLGTMQAING